MANVCFLLEISLVGQSWNGMSSDLCLAVARTEICFLWDCPVSWYMYCISRSCINTKQYKSQYIVVCRSIIMVTCKMACPKNEKYYFLVVSFVHVVRISRQCICKWLKKCQVSHYVSWHDQIQSDNMLRYQSPAPNPLHPTLSGFDLICFTVKLRAPKANWGNIQIHFQNIHINTYPSSKSKTSIKYFSLKLKMHILHISSERWCISPYSLYKETRALRKWEMGAY